MLVDVLMKPINGKHFTNNKIIYKIRLSQSKLGGNRISWDDYHDQIRLASSTRHLTLNLVTTSEDKN